MEYDVELEWCSASTSRLFPVFSLRVRRVPTLVHLPDDYSNSSTPVAAGPRRLMLDLLINVTPYPEPVSSDRLDVPPSDRSKPHVAPLRMVLARTPPGPFHILPGPPSIVAESFPLPLYNTAPFPVPDRIAQLQSARLPSDPTSPESRSPFFAPLQSGPPADPRRSLRFRIPSLHSQLLSDEPYYRNRRSSLTTPTRSNSDELLPAVPDSSTIPPPAARRADLPSLLTNPLCSIPHAPFQLYRPWWVLPSLLPLSPVVLAHPTIL